MSAQINKELTRQFLNAFNGNDTRKLEDLCTVDLFSDMQQRLAWVNNTFTDHRLEITEMIAEADRVATRVKSRSLP